MRSVFGAAKRAVCCVLAGAVIALCGCSGRDGESGDAHRAHKLGFRA